MLEIRRYVSTDCPHLAGLFYETIHTVNAKHYTKEQLNAWAAGKVDLEEWNESFSEHDTVIAVKHDTIVGFGDMDQTGYLDRLFVHQDYQRQGIASAICDELEGAADAARFITHSSITAKPFFESRGYRVIAEQQVVRAGIPLTNYVMEKLK